ncbi:MAG: flavodoxin family protein [Candidatus Omnitrophota bacterium]|jgi:multimeric flavodoxin WrbA
MKLIAVNGSPRKNWNTAELLKSAAQGAQAGGMETEIVHLYDLDYKGCKSCFACKYKNSDSYGRCAIKDGLTPVLKMIEEQAGVLILGTPVYFGAMTGEMRSFLERLVFAPIVYTVPATTLFPRKIKTAMIYTMNATEDMSRQRHYDILVKGAEAYLKMIFGHAESYCCYDTCQFPDYSKVEMELFDPVKKAERKEKAFPRDCENAYNLGYQLSRA